MECYSLTRILSPDENLKDFLKNTNTDEQEELKKHQNDGTYFLFLRAFDNTNQKSKQFL